MQVSSVHVLAIRTSGPGWGEIHSAKENGGDGGIHTCNIRVWTEVKGAIVVLGWAGTVRCNILLDS